MVEPLGKKLIQLYSPEFLILGDSVQAGITVVKNIKLCVRGLHGVWEMDPTRSTGSPQRQVRKFCHV